MAGFYVFDTRKQTTLTRTIASIAISFASTCLISLVFVLLSPYTGKSIVYMFFLLPPVVNTWQYGLRGGIFSIIFSVAALFYFTFYYQLITPLHVSAVLPLIFFFIESAIIIYVVDITRKTDLVALYEHKLIQSQKEVQKTKELLTKTHSEIKARDEFLSIASHELKTPITSMLLQLQTALHNIRNVSLANFSVDSLLKMLESAESQSMRVSKLINDLLNVSLITTGKLDLERQEMNLSQTTHEVLERFNEKIKKEGYQVTIEAENHVTGYWDKLRIEQVISNLLTNALKYGNNKPITIRISQTDKIGRIIVIDNGIGIAQEKVNSIFRKFERAVETPEYKGLGVGLYITHQIVKAHGGVIKVSSKLHKGSIFIIELPLGISSNLTLPSHHLAS